jgi:hypothetical protein
MYISKEIIETLKAQGINVRWFPEETYEDFKQRVWQEMYDYSFNYSKSFCKELNPSKEGVYSWSYETLAEYEEHCRKFADQTWERHASPYEFTTLYVEHDNGQMLVKKENVKSKEITVEYVQKLVEKDRKVYAGTYGKFAMCMQRLCKERGLTNKFCVYPTTYGIGVWLFYNFNSGKHIAQVEEIMKERGIEYYNEYSDAMWVYRFKVSKKRENIERMCA